MLKNISSTIDEKLRISARPCNIFYALFATISFSCWHRPNTAKAQDLFLKNILRRGYCLPRQKADIRMTKMTTKTGGLVSRSKSTIVCLITTCEQNTSTISKVGCCLKKNKILYFQFHAIPVICNDSSLLNILTS